MLPGTTRGESEEAQQARRADNGEDNAMHHNKRVFGCKGRLANVQSASTRSVVQAVSNARKIVQVKVSAQHRHPKIEVSIV